MLAENLKYFWNNCDFEMLANFLSNADPLEVALNPYVLIPTLIIVTLIFIPRTSEYGQKLLLYIPAIGYVVVTGVVLRNDVISNIGPFILALTSFFMVIGWLIYTQFISN